MVARFLFNCWEIEEAGDETQQRPRHRWQIREYSEVGETEPGLHHVEKVCKQVLLRELWSIGWSTIETRNELCLVGFLLVIFLCYLYYSLHTYYLVVIINVTVVPTLRCSWRRSVATINIMVGCCSCGCYTIAHDRGFCVQVGWCIEDRVSSQEW